MNIKYFKKLKLNNSKVPSKYNINISILHFLGIFFVMYGHQYPLMGRDATVILGHSISTIGVEMLFVLSGYLQMQSLEQTPLNKYLKKKIFRIIPDYYLYLLIMTFGVGVIISTYSLKNYLLSSDTWNFLFQNALFYPNYYLPGVFENSLFNSSVNISLWTLPIEFALHLLLPFIVMGCKSIDRKNDGKITFGAVMLLFIGLYFYQLHTGLTSNLEIWGTKISNTIRLIAFFLAGSYVKMLSAEKYISPNIFLIAILFLVFGPKSFQLFLLPIIIIMATIVFISQPQILNCKLGLFKASYGIFLWMWPIQQIVLLYFNFAKDNFYLAFIVSLLLTIILAAFMTKIREYLLKN